MGGGSIPNLPATMDKDLLKAVAAMEPYDLPGNPEHQYAMSNPGQDYLLYADNGDTISIDLTGIKADFESYNIDLKTGKAASDTQLIKGGERKEIALTQTPCLLWLRRISYKQTIR
jgi:hypothetical protein